MPLERRYSIGVSDDGTRFMTHVTFGYDMGGLSDRQVNQLRNVLSDKKLLGESVSSLEFEQYLGDRTTISGPELQAVVTARDFMIRMFQGRSIDLI